SQGELEPIPADVGREAECAFSTATNHPHYSGKRWSNRVQQTEAGSNVIILPQRSHDHVYSTLDIFVGVYHKHHQRPHPLLVNPGGDPLLCSHSGFFPLPMDFILGGQAEKVCSN
ncbi:unnamed protein product, partial [Pleuronectes platessa]